MAGAAVLLVVAAVSLALLRIERRHAEEAASVEERAQRAIVTVQNERDVAVGKAEQNAQRLATLTETAFSESLVSWGAPPGTKDIASSELATRLEADVRITRMKLDPGCAEVTVSYYVPSAPNQHSINRLTEIWSQLGFRVQPVTFGISQPMNAIWRGESVHPTCWRAVACTLIRAGIPVRGVGRPQRDAVLKRRTIEIGYSGPARNDPPLTIGQIWEIN